MKQSKYIFILVLRLLGWDCMEAKAGPITTFAFNGFVTNIADPTNLLNGQVQLGTPFEGQFSVDLSTPDSDPFDGGRGIYLDAITLIQGQVWLFDFSGPSSSSGIDIRDGRVLFVSGKGGFEGLFGRSTGAKLKKAKNFSRRSRSAWIIRYGRGL